MTGNSTENGFMISYQWLSDKWKCGYLCMSLWAYFFLCIIVFGCMGIWCEIAFKSSLPIAILSSSYAIAGASSADFIFIEQKNCIRSIPIYVGAFIALLSLIFCLFRCSWIQYPTAIISLIIASAMWFLINAGKIKDIDPQNSVGGDVHNPFSGKSNDAKL